MLSLYMLDTPHPTSHLLRGEVLIDYNAIVRCNMFEHGYNLEGFYTHFSIQSMIPALLGSFAIIASFQISRASDDIVYVSDKVLK